jgi:signal peptidase I
VTEHDGTIEPHALTGPERDAVTEPEAVTDREARTQREALPEREALAEPPDRRPVSSDPPPAPGPFVTLEPAVPPLPPAAREPIALAPGPDLRLTSPGIRLAQVRDELVAWLKTLVSAAVYAVLIVTFGFQVARVEGQSMAPTLEDQDRLIVNKLVYRIGEPRRGDIVMLYYPLNPEKSFVKRVIAEEGDTVRIVDGRVYVNDIPLKDDYVASDYRSHDDWGPQVINEGYYFVMGDHRNNSSDSRHWGMVPKKYIIGKVQIRWWPVPTARVF